MTLLPILQQTISPHISSYSEIKIKESATPAAVYRLALGYDRRDGPATLILKRIQPEFPDDPGFPDREMRFYSCVLPQLDIPHPYIFFTGMASETQERLILMEDLVEYRLPPPTRPWTEEEGFCIARTYARLHAGGRSALPPEAERTWMLPRHESRLEPEMIQRMVGDLVIKNLWEPIPGLDALLTRITDASIAFTRLPASLLHNDVYPPNVALPPNLDGDAILLDWEMAGYGLPEMDLGFMFLQPHRAHRNLDRAQVLEAYWAARDAREGMLPTLEEREVRQFYADAVWGFWLVPVAHRVAVRPYSPGSVAAVYWESMFCVLEEHLRRLSQKVLL